jgi:hypothetical protein
LPAIDLFIVGQFASSLGDVLQLSDFAETGGVRWPHRILHLMSSARAIVRLLIIAITSAAMSLLGVWLLDRDPNNDFTLGGYAYITCISVILWIGLSFLVARSNLAATVAVGLISPLIGGLVVCPGASHIHLLENWKITFPIGVATALLVRFTTYLTDGLWWQVIARRSQCPKCGYDLRGQSQALEDASTSHPPTQPIGSRCPECGHFVGAVGPN